MHPGTVTQQPDTAPHADEMDEFIAIRARVWEILARTGLTPDQLPAVIGADPAKIAASFAGERRFSTYELAAIATHGGTTVEWLVGQYPDYEYVEHPDAAWYRALPIEARVEFEDELAASTTGGRAALLAAWRSTGQVYADPELLAVLTRDHHGDGGPVPMPVVPEARP